MKRTEEFIERGQAATVIAFKIFMMQVVKIITAVQAELVADYEFLKSTMTKCWIKSGKVNLVEGIDRVQCQQPLYYSGREIKNLLHWMHGKAGPWAYLNVAMMDRMDGPVERLYVQEAMCEVEVNGMNQRSENNQ